MVCGTSMSGLDVSQSDWLEERSATNSLNGMVVMSYSLTSAKEYKRL